MEYKKLYEKWARGEKIRAYSGLVLGALSIAANLAILKQLREERKTAGQ